MRLLISGLFVLGVLGLAGTSAAFDDSEEKVPVDKLPKAIVEGAKKRFPKAELVEASKETSEGKTSYEVSMKQDGKTIDVTFTPEGVMTLIEKQIDAKSLPKSVAATLAAKYPKATHKLIEELIKVADGKETLESYEVLLVTSDMKTLEVVFSPDGKVTKEEEKRDK